MKRCTTFLSASVLLALLHVTGCVDERAAPRKDRPAATPPAAAKLPAVQISAEFPFAPHHVPVLDSKMHYVESGQGRPVVFIHGNPTSSYVWRNVIPYVARDHRAIAVDLIGMGRSGKPEIAYSFDDHFRYLEALLDALKLTDITLVVHDWGAALGFEYARKYPGKVRAIAFMEGMLPPAFPQPSFAAMGDEMGGMFKGFKDAVQGQNMVVENNMFIEKILPMMVNRTLNADEMNVYRAPYLDKAARAPLLAWPVEAPIGGEPARTTKLLSGLATFMGSTELPVLLLYASPGVLVPEEVVGWYRKTIKNIETAYVGQGLHFLQEDQPDAIGLAISEWLRRHASTAATLSGGQHGN